MSRAPGFSTEYPGKQPSRLEHVGAVFLPKVGDHHLLFLPDARVYDKQGQARDQEVHPVVRDKGCAQHEREPKRVHGVPDAAIRAGRHELVVLHDVERGHPELP